MFTLLPFSILDLLIGFCLMNSLPHLLFSVMRIHFISPFGYTSANQLAWSALNMGAALVLFHLQYGIGTLLQNGIMLGALLVYGAFAVSGRFFYDLFNRDR